MSTYECDDFRVIFTRMGAGEADAAEYQVVAQFGQGRTLTSTFRLPMSSLRLEELVVNLGRSGMREIAPDDMQLVHTDAQQLGTELGTALFDAVIGPGFNEAERTAAAQRRGLRLTLSLGETPELLSVPWELLFWRRRFLASQRHTPIVRYLEVGDVPPPLPIDGPTRVLGVVASPSGLAPLDVADERARVVQALGGMIERGLVELEWCDPATPRSLRHCLRDGTFHILHFVGHSDFDGAGNGVLYLLDDDGAPAPVTDTVLNALLSDQTSLRLVVLNSCKGARTTLTDPFGGIATGLVALGLPAVVAMQFSISDKAAIVFAEELFTSLIGRQYPIDAAVSEARKAVLVDVSEIEWATPVLFLRAFDGLLFDFAAAPEAIPLKVAPLPVIDVDKLAEDPSPLPRPSPPPPQPPRPPDPNSQEPAVPLPTEFADEVDRERGELHVDDDVQFTVYRPSAVTPEEWHQFIAFAHRTTSFALPSGTVVDPIKQVEQRAAHLLSGLPTSFESVRTDSQAGLPRGIDLLFEPWIEQGEFNPRIQSLTWEEAVHEVLFRLRVPKTADGSRLRGGMRVFAGAVLIGDLSFRLPVVTEHNAATVPIERDTTRRFKQIFASYSHLDGDVVDILEQYVSVTGDRYLVDTRTLRSGEVWDDRLFELIEEADVFQLFWSRNAMASEFVKREWQHALQLGREGFVRPVYWEDPLPEDPSLDLPPDGLRRLHFSWLDVAPLRTGTRARSSCLACGHVNRDDDSFCRSCGGFLPPGPQGGAGASPMPTSPAVTPAARTAPAPDPSLPPETEFAATTAPPAPAPAAGKQRMSRTAGVSTRRRITSRPLLGLGILVTAVVVVVLVTLGLLPP